MEKPEQDLLLMVGEIRSDVKQLLASKTDFETRISSLEKWRYILTGLAAAGGSVIPTAIAKALGLH